ncbi:MAG: response regulator [Candidatus Heimdallarchaeota archaeon]|nr:response regulator [Candidatus Heimdallarchaeota archaeon]
MSANESLKNKVNLLITDDDKDIREIFIEILKRSGYVNIESAGTGEEAIEILSNKFIDIALIDLNLPDINGIDLISQYRTISPDTEFIIITGYGSIDSAIKAMQFDVGGYLEKPVSGDKLLRTLDEVLVKHNLKIENQRFLKDLEHANKEILFLNDLLVNNVDELNQSLLLTMVQIEKLNPTDEQKKVLRLFQQAIRKNARLTRNIKKLQLIDKKRKSDLVEIDITKTFNTAINRLRSDYSDKSFEIHGILDQSNMVLADNDLLHFITELLLISILNDPNPKIRINLEFNNVNIKGIDYLKLNVRAFHVKYIFDQRNITHPSDLMHSTNDQSFQDLGPFVINSLLKFYKGYLEMPDENDGNLIDIFLPKSVKK